MGRPQRRPFLTPIWLTAIGAFLAVIFLAFAVFLAWDWATADSTTVVVVQDDHGGLLLRMFGEAKAPHALNAIYVSPILGSTLTVAPLAAKLGLKPMVTGDTPQDLAQRALHEHAGGRVLIVTRGNMVNRIVEALGGAKQLPPIGDPEEGAMYIVSVPRIGRANVLRANY